MRTLKYRRTITQKNIALVIIVVITGCVGGIDVTTDPDFQFGYRRGQVYKSKIDLYIVYAWNNYLLAPGKDSPELVEYLKDPSKYSDIKGVLEVNSIVRIEKLSYRDTFEASYLDVHATILNGEFRNELVILNHVSEIEVKRPPKGGFMRKPDPKILKLVEAYQKVYKNSIHPKLSPLVGQSKKFITD